MEKQRELLIKEYQQALDTHDWNYQYSDDIEVWRKGSENEHKLLEMCNNDHELYVLYRNKQKLMKRD